MLRIGAILLSLLLLPAGDLVAGPVPIRVLSLDYCADAYALAFFEESEIAALSPDARAPYAWGRVRASGLPSHRGEIEDILARRPTLVLRAGSGNARLAAFFARYRIETLELGYAESLEDARAATRLLGTFSGREARAEAILADLDRRLERVAGRVAALDGHHRRPTALYLTPSGITSGSGTYIDEAMHLAGLDNLLGRRGVRGFSQLDTELMAGLRPDLMIASFFDARAGHGESWRFSLHAVTERAIAGSARHDVPAGKWGCAGFFLIDAIEDLLAAREVWQGGKDNRSGGTVAGR